MLPYRLNTFDLFGLTPTSFEKKRFLFKGVRIRKYLSGNGLSKMYNFKTIMTNPKQETFVCKLFKNWCSPVERASLTMTKKSRFPGDYNLSVSVIMSD